MKSIIKNLLTPFILSSSLLLVGCMPDSLTKFKEDAPKKKETNGGIIVAPPPESCTPNTPSGGYCTPLSGVTYQTIVGNDHKITINASNFGKPIEPLTPTLFPAGNNAGIYTFFSITPSLPAGLSFNANSGTISGTPTAAIAKTLYTVRATHSNYTSSPVQTQFYLSVGTALGGLTYNDVGYNGTTNTTARLIISFPETESTPLGTPSNPRYTVAVGNTPNFSAENGARGMVRYINYQTNELFVEPHQVLSEERFKDDTNVDTFSSYFSARGKISGITVGFPRLSSISALLPVTVGGRRLIRSIVSPMDGVTFLTNETNLFSYSITPGFPAGSGISLNTTTGEIVWNTAVLNPKIDREDYIVSVRNTLGEIASYPIRLSIQEVAAPKTIADFYFPQTVGKTVILKVASPALFKPLAKLSGKLTLNGTATVTGAATNFTAELTVGSKFVLNEKIYEVASVTSPSALTLTAPSVDTAINSDAFPINSAISGFSDNGTPLVTSDDISLTGLVEFIDEETGEIFVKISNYPAGGALAAPRKGFHEGMFLYNGAVYQSQVDTVEKITYSININSPIGILEAPTILPFHQNGPILPANIEDTQQIASQSLKTEPTLSSISGSLDLITNSPVIADPNELGSITSISPVAEISEKQIKYTFTDIFKREFTKTLNIRFDEPPSNIALTKQAILVFNSSLYPLTYLQNNFQIGAYISSPIEAPSTEAKRAKIKEIFEVVGTNETYMIVDVISGTFKASTAIDNWRKYAIQKAFTKKVINNSFKLRLNATAAGILSIDQELAFTNGAHAKVNLINASDIYITLLNDGEISNGDTLINLATGVNIAPVRTVSEIHANQLKFNVVNAATHFAPGMDIVTYYGGGVPPDVGARGRGQINFRNGNLVSVTMTNGYFLNADALSNENSDRNTVSSITSTPSSENLFTLFRGQETTIQLHLKTGKNSNLSIYPPLPDGLTIDKENLRIIGKPNEPKVKTLYTVYAINGAGSSEFSFFLRVHSSFEIVEETETRSPILHQSGRGNASKNCIVTDDMITAGNNMIDCHLDVGELDLSQNGIKFASNTTAGICSYVAYNPYGYHLYEPKTTNRRYIEYSGDESCFPVPGVKYPEGAPRCIGDYTNVMPNSTGPNCDSGRYLHRIISFSRDAGVCVSSSSESIVECGGHSSQCIAGAVKNEYDANQLENNVRRTVIFAELGLQHQFKQVPATAGYVNNIPSANFSFRNSCISQTDPWAYRTAEWYYMQFANSNGYADPFKRLNPFYTFTCLDTADGITARIDVKVRDWDRDFVVPSAPSIEPIESTHMSNASYDNKADWDSERYIFLGVLPAPQKYDPGFCNIGVANEGYLDPSTQPVLVHTGTVDFTSPHLNFMRLDAALLDSVQEDDLLVVTADNGVTNSYFTVEEGVAAGEDVIFVSRPYNSGDYFDRGISVVNIYKIPSTRRIKFPGDVVYRSTSN